MDIHQRHRVLCQHVLKTESSSSQQSPKVSPQAPGEDVEGLARSGGVWIPTARHHAASRTQTPPCPSSWSGPLEWERSPVCSVRYRRLALVGVNPQHLESGPLFGVIV